MKVGIQIAAMAVGRTQAFRALLTRAWFSSAHATSSSSLLQREMLDPVGQVFRGAGFGEEIQIANTLADRGTRMAFQIPQVARDDVRKISCPTWQKVCTSVRDF